MRDAGIAPEEAARREESRRQLIQIPAGESRKPRGLDPAGARSFVRVRRELRIPAAFTERGGDLEVSVRTPCPAGVAGGGMDHDPGADGPIGPLRSDDSGLTTAVG